MTSPLDWHQLHWPRPLNADEPVAAVRAWAADQRSPRLVLETRADGSGVRYLLGCSAGLARTVIGQARGAVPELRVTPDAAERRPVQTVGRLRLSTRHRALRTDPAESAVRQVLSAFLGLGQNEVLVLQVVLGPRRLPLAIPNQSPSSVVMPWYQVAWQGNDRQVDAEKRSALRDKVSDHGFAITIRLGAAAKTAERRQQLVHRLLVALKVSEAPGIRLRLVPDFTDNLNLARSPWSWPLRLNASEVVALSGWPVGENDLPAVGPIHPRLIAPSALAKPGERIIGSAAAPGVDGNVGLSVSDSLRHVWVLGPNGTGKSTLLLNLIHQDLTAGRSVAVIEPKDLIAELLSRIPADRLDDVVLLDPIDTMPVGLNPLASHGRQPDVVADSVFALFHHLYGDGLGPRSSDILYNALTVLSTQPDASLVMLPLLLTNPVFRRPPVRAAAERDPIVAAPFWRWYDGLSEDARSQAIAPLSNKLRPLLRPALRGVIGQCNPRFDIRQVLQGRKLLLVPLQPGVVGPDTAELLAALVVNELWLGIRARAALPQRDRRPISIYLDEVQDYLRLPTDLSDALATSRSLGAAWHLAHQYRDQLSPVMQRAFEANARSRICFQLPAADARAMAAGQSVLAPDDFSALPAYQAYAQLVRGNTVQPWASVSTLPPPPESSDPTEVRRRSRNQFGHDRIEVEADFRRLLSPSEPSVEEASGRRRRSTP